MCPPSPGACAIWLSGPTPNWAPDVLEAFRPRPGNRRVAGRTGHPGADDRKRANRQRTSGSRCVRTPAWPWSSSRLARRSDITGGVLREAIAEGIRQGYREGYLRKSVCHPLTRVNTGDNTRPMVHFDLVAGDRLRITVAPKGFGSENMSRVTLLPPSAGMQGGQRLCGAADPDGRSEPLPANHRRCRHRGTFEQTALLAKKALLRPLGSPNPDAELWPPWSTTGWRRSTAWASAPRVWGGGSPPWPCTSTPCRATSPASPWRSTSSVTRPATKRPTCEERNPA